MGTIQKAEIQSWFKDQTGSQVVEGQPVQVSNIVAPVWIMNPITNIVKTGEKATTNSLTVFTTSAVKKTFITSAHLSIVKDAACDMATGSLQLSVIINGVALSIIRIAVLTLTAQNQTVSVSFPPLQVDPNTAVVIGGTWAAGTCCRCGGIEGYEI